MKMIKSERGQSLVELAISIVILLYLLAGAVEFGIAFFQFVQLRDAAQEGALYGSLNPTVLGPIDARVRGASSSPINLSNTGLVTVNVRATDKTSGTTKLLADACEGDGLEVEVRFDHQIFMPFIPDLIGSNTIPLSAVVTDTILTPVCP